LHHFQKRTPQDYRVRVWVNKKNIDSIEKITKLLIDTPKGKIPFSKFGVVKGEKRANFNYKRGIILHN